jgi:probable HAF family extracellular repeat protein
MRSLYALIAAGAVIGCGDAIQARPTAQTVATEYQAINLGSLAPPGDPNGGGSRALGVNNSGQVVGWSKTGEEIPTTCCGTFIVRHAFVYDSGTMRDLGTLGGASSSAELINDRGQVAGTSTTATRDTRAFFWDDGVMTDIGTLGGTYSDVRGLSPTGMLVGSSTTVPGSMHAYLWQAGLLQDLGTLGGDYGTAAAINAGGRVVGESRTVDGDTHAYLWDSGVMTDLGTLGGTFSTARAISDAGVVTGWSTDSAGVQHAFAWQDGVMQDLGVIPGFATSQGRVVNNLGQIAGQVAQSGTVEEHGVLWDGGAAYDVGTLGANRTFVNALNDRGQIVGTSLTCGSVSCGRAFLWEDGTLRDLGSLPGFPSYAYATATAVNPRGDVVGWTGLSASSDMFRAVLWRRVSDVATSASTVQADP